MKYIVLYNPYAGNNAGNKAVEAMKQILAEEEMQILDMTEVDIRQVLTEISKEEGLIVCGGDGTLNHIANDLKDFPYEHSILYYPTGTGNDFANDMASERREDGLYEVSQYLKKLPTVYVNGKERLFLNGIGYGIDGYCCEEGDRLREKSDKPVNYTSIAIKGLLFHYKPTHAKVTVDGTEYEYDYSWLCPTMKGRFYGGGMMMCPMQDRKDAEGKVTFACAYAKNKFKILMAFPSIFKGQHVNKKNLVDFHSGKEVSVEFDRPVALQIDGETVLNVTSYKVKA